MAYAYIDLEYEFAKFLNGPKALVIIWEDVEGEKTDEDDKYAKDMGKVSKFWGRRKKKTPATSPASASTPASNSSPTAGASSPTATGYAVPGPSSSLWESTSAAQIVPAQPPLPRRTPPPPSPRPAHHPLPTPPRMSYPRTAFVETNLINHYNATTHGQVYTGPIPHGPAYDDYHRRNTRRNFVDPGLAPPGPSISPPVPNLAAPTLAPVSSNLAEPSHLDIGSSVVNSVPNFVLIRRNTGTVAVPVESQANRNADVSEWTTTTAEAASQHHQHVPAAHVASDGGHNDAADDVADDTASSASSVKGYVVGDQDTTTPDEPLIGIHTALSGTPTCVSGAVSRASTPFSSSTTLVDPIELRNAPRFSASDLTNRLAAHLSTMNWMEIASRHVRAPDSTNTCGTTPSLVEATRTPSGRVPVNDANLPVPPSSPVFGMRDSWAEPTTSTSRPLPEVPGEAVEDSPPDFPVPLRLTTGGQIHSYGRTQRMPGVPPFGFGDGRIAFTLDDRGKFVDDNEVYSHDRRAEAGPSRACTSYYTVNDVVTRAEHAAFHLGPIPEVGPSRPLPRPRPRPLPPTPQASSSNTPELVNSPQESPVTPSRRRSSGSEQILTPGVDTDTNPVSSPLGMPLESRTHADSAAEENEDEDVPYVGKGKVPMRPSLNRQERYASTHTDA